MILPDKNLPLTKSILGVGYLLIKNLRHRQTPSSLWDTILKEDKYITFDKYILCLDLLYAIDVVYYKDGLLELVNK